MKPSNKENGNENNYDNGIENTHDNRNRNVTTPEIIQIKT